MITIGNKKSKTIVGLDIEASTIAATELQTNGHPNVAGFGVARLDSGVFRDGEVHEPAELAAALKELFGTNKLSKDVRLGIANQRVAVRTLRLPRLDDPAELETAIRFQAQDHIPVPLDQAVLDWQVIPRQNGADTDAEEGMEVVVVAARRDMLASAIEAVQGAGLRLVGIDLSAFGLVRALDGEGAGTAAPAINGAPTEFDPLGQSDATAAGEVADAGLPGRPPTRLLCHLGDLTNLAVARGSYCVFTRVSNFGLEGVAQSLAEQTALTLEHSRQWLTHVGLDAAPEAIDGDPRTVAATREVLSAGAGRLGEEMRRSLEYFDSFDGSLPVDQVVVAGPGTAIPGLVDRLQSEFSLPLVAATPGRLEAAAGSEASRLTVSYGLGLEE